MKEAIRFRLTLNFYQCFRPDHSEFCLKCVNVNFSILLPKDVKKKEKSLWVTETVITVNKYPYEIAPQYLFTGKYKKIEPLNLELDLDPLYAIISHKLTLYYTQAKPATLFY